MTNIAQATPTMQLATDGKMQKRMQNNYVRSLIDEYAQYRNGRLSLFVSELSKDEQKIFVSHIDLDDMQASLEEGYSLDTVLLNYRAGMQRIIDELIDDIYAERMTEWRNTGRCSVTIETMGKVIILRGSHDEDAADLG